MMLLICFPALVFVRILTRYHLKKHWHSQICQIHPNSPKPHHTPTPQTPVPRSCADSLHGDDDWATAEAQLFEALAEHLPAQGPAGPWGPLEPDFAPRGFGATRWAATRGWDFGDVLGFPLLVGM